MRIVKLLIHVSAEEQKKRMIERLDKPSKHYKIGLEDFRNIAKRKQYLDAYDDMLRADRHATTPHGTSSPATRRCMHD